MHGWHGGELVDEFAAHPDGLRVVVAHCVEEAVFFGEETGWHAGVYDEGEEGAEVGEREGAAGVREGVKGGRDVVVPADEAVEVSCACGVRGGGECLPDGAWDVDQRIALIQYCERVLVALHEPLLYVPLADGEEEAQHAVLFCF